MLSDMIWYLTEKYEEASKVVKATSDQYWMNATPELLLKGALFVLAFNFIFWASSFFFRKLWPCRLPIESEMAEAESFGLFENTILLLLVWGIFIPLWYYGLDFFELIEKGLEIPKLIKWLWFLMPLGAARSYEMIVRKKYAMAMAFLLPLIYSLSASGSRAWFTCAVGAIAVAWFRQQSRLTAKFYVSLCSVVVVVPLFMAGIRVVHDARKRDNGVDLVNDSLILAFKDMSIGEFYYTLSNEYFEEESTQGASTKALLATPVILPFMNRELYSEDNQVIFKIYRLRYGFVDYGSLHPTLYGWAYFDLKYWGLLLAIWTSVACELCELLTASQLAYRGIAAAVLSQFIILGMRGSLHIAFTRLYFGGLFCFAVLVAVRSSRPVPLGHVDKKRKKRILNDSQRGERDS